MDTERFFADLGRRLDSARRDDQLRYQEFFSGLKPQLDAAKHLERELNRRLAHRFNVLDYLRTDELGLSSVIADLLDPRANHGQGPFFLQVMLEKLELTEHWPDLDLAGATVSVERVITAQRRIDISVKIPDGSGEYCLAIENKPYAGDQENQVRDYLKHLAREFGDRFVLIYLSPAGDPPSDWSLPRSELDQWKGRFAVMAYHEQDNSEGTANEADTVDVYEAFSASLSLTDWLDFCHDKCQVERLRWFLSDARSFCQRTFGDHHMTTDSEARAVEEYLLSNPENLAVALKVYESWPAVRDHICRQFLEQICSRVEQNVKQSMPDCAHDTVVGCSYYRNTKEPSRLWLYRSSWQEYRVDNSHTNGRTYIFLEATNKEQNGWYYGVASPLSVNKMTEAEQIHRSTLDQRLKAVLDIGRRADWGPQWSYVDDRKRNWNGLVPDLRAECEADGGEIMDYFVDLITDVAVRAIPAISEI